MKSSNKQLVSRGYASLTELEHFSNKSTAEILALLQSNNPSQRSTAAKVLASCEALETVDALIVALKKERKLYSKIAISEALGSMGETAAVKLVSLLGEIGSNQYHQLPDKPFLKKNYPLPRDIVARTLIKIGVPALLHLIEVLHQNNQTRILEAIDAIGCISFYSGNSDAKNDLLNLLQQSEDPLVIWKILRALQAFPSFKVENTLKIFCQSTNLPQHRWEAERSLNQINRLKILRKETPNAN